MRAGKLRFRVLIQAPNLIDNGAGGRKRPASEEAWSEVGTVAAHIIALRGEEAVRNLVENAVQLWRVEIRTGISVTPLYRLKWASPVAGEVIMDIKAIALNEDRDGIILSCESGVRKT